MSLADIEKQPHWVYELWAGDRCYYIGATVNLPRRLSDHRRCMYGWQQITEVRVRQFPTRGKALGAEAALIWGYRPPCNARHNPDHDRQAHLPKRAQVFQLRLAALDGEAATPYDFPLARAAS